MGGFAGSKLSVAVSKAGGLGLIGAVNDMPGLSAKLADAESKIDRLENGLLPIGVGVLLFITPIEEALPILEKSRPAVIWLFAANEIADYGLWAERVRSSSALTDCQLWIQVGSVAAALEIAKAAKPDVLCVQGADAGGHGYERGAGIISLLPEISDALASNGHESIALVTAGGISDGRSAAAAFTLGAQGVVMGTRFLAAEETTVHPTYQSAIVAASDGGQSTVRSKLFDNLRGANIWPGAYDGRSIVVKSFEEFEDGTSIEDIRERHNEAVKGEEKGYEVHGNGRAVMWAGTGVGFAKKVQPAGEIVEEVRSVAAKVLREAAAKL